MIVTESPEVFSAKVRAGDLGAWKTVKRAIKQTGSVNKAPSVLGVSQRTLYYWLANVDGLREFTGG